jgi:hypothetical protein
MDNSSTYDTDILVWSEQQASALRDLALSRRDLPNELDLEHVAEEIECVGRSELFAVQSLIRQILIHIIKAVSVPEADAARHWRSEVVGFHDDLLGRVTPSMIGRIDIAALWRRARKRAEADLAEHDQVVAASLPRDCPIDLQAVVDPEFKVAQAIEQVQAAMRSIDKRD